MYQQIAEDRVKAGVLFLDRVVPNWRDKVKLTPYYDIIDLRDDVFGEPTAVFNHCDRRDLINFGLSVDFDDNFDSMFTAVNGAWLKVLVKETK